MFGIAAFLLALFGGNTDAFRRAMEQLPREVYMSAWVASGGQVPRSGDYRDDRLTS